MNNDDVRKVTILDDVKLLDGALGPTEIELPVGWDVIVF